MKNHFIRYKTEVYLNDEQKKIADAILGSLRSLKNKYLSDNLMRIKQQNAEPYTPEQYLSFMSDAFTADPNNPLVYMRNMIPYRSRIMALEHTQRAMKRSKTKVSKDPTFYYKNHQKVKYHFKPSDKAYVTEFHARIPRIGLVKIADTNYLPTSQNPRNHRGTPVRILAYTLAKKGDRYYLSVQTMINDGRYPSRNPSQCGPAIGLDLGVKILAQSSNGTTYENINKSDRVKKLIKKQIREIKKLDRMKAQYAKRKDESTDDAYISRKNLDKQHIVVQNIIKQLYNVRMDYTNKVISDVLSSRPAFIAIEDINSTEMQKEAKSAKNDGFATAISQSWLYTFKKRLTERCIEENVELRMIDKWYASSQICNKCGHKQHMALDMRTYVCPTCGTVIDRDLNAALNIKDCEKFTRLV